MTGNASTGKFLRKPAEAGWRGLAAIGQQDVTLRLPKHPKRFEIFIGFDGRGELRFSVREREDLEVSLGIEHSHLIMADRVQQRAFGARHLPTGLIIQQIAAFEHRPGWGGRSDNQVESAGGDLILDLGQFERADEAAVGNAVNRGNDVVRRNNDEVPIITEQGAVSANVASNPQRFAGDGVGGGDALPDLIHHGIRIHQPHAPQALVQTGKPGG